MSITTVVIILAAVAIVALALIGRDARSRVTEIRRRTDIGDGDDA
jgi:hypothetical protein